MLLHMQNVLPLPKQNVFLFRKQNVLSFQKHNVVFFENHMFFSRDRSITRMFGSLWNRFGVALE